MTEHGTDPKGEVGKTKPQLHLIPREGMIHQAAAHKLGADKYGAWNWREHKVCASTYIGAILRHTLEYQERVEADPESGASPLGHVMASCAILLDAAKCGTLVDDRAKPIS
jgi:hypothetical protein